MRFAKVLGIVGRVLIWAGSIVLLFVAYQLWGTNIAEARAQDDLEEDFAELLESRATTTTTTSTTAPDVTSTTRPTTTTTTEPPPPPEPGEAMGRIIIPAIGLDKFVVEGVGRSDLQKGPGHYPGTPMPGQPGNSAIAGHRTTYGAPFNRVDELEIGDEIRVDTLQGSFLYEVSGQEIVTPDRVDVVEDQGDNRLTLTSCHPKYSARQRIIITAHLVDDPAPTTTTTSTTTPSEPVDDLDELPDEELPDDPVDEEPVDEEPVDDEPVSQVAELETLDGSDTRTAGPAVLWGAVTLAVWLAFYALSRRWRRWPAYLLGAPVFLVALFVFFEAFAKLLPSNF